MSDLLVAIIAELFGSQPSIKKVSRNISFSCTQSNIFCDLEIVQQDWLIDWLIAAGAYPDFRSMKQLAVFLLPLDGMLVHVWFPQQCAGTHLHTWVERSTVGIKCLGQEHNTMSPARA